MAQHSNEHLTTAQLSAYLDKELASDELALCDAHLPACQSCQSTLAELRLTSNLLHSLPQVEVPRSFVLPDNLVVLPDAYTSEEHGTRRARQNQQLWRRALRSFSAVAALLGLLLVLLGTLSGVSSSLPIRTSAMAPVSNSAAQSPQSPPTATAAGRSTTYTPQPSFEMPSRANKPDHVASTPASASNQPAESPPVALDLGGPAGLLGGGGILLVLGIVGLVLTRRRGTGQVRRH